MSFTWTDHHRTQYHTQNFVVFQQIIPPTLIADLRRTLAPVPDLARSLKGPNAIRLQPLQKFADQLDLAPIQDFLTLPALVDAIHRTLSPDHQLDALDSMGLLFHPQHPVDTTRWHRDLTVDTPGVDPATFNPAAAQTDFFNQVNCPLYTDTCTWYVPASANRPDTPTEPTIRDAVPTLDGLTPEQQEALSVTYSRSMPGALQFILEPGDFALYNPLGWHLGAYTTYRQRATLHFTILDQKAKDWYNTWSQASSS